jgi:hypothetical protein
MLAAPRTRDMSQPSESTTETTTASAGAGVDADAEAEADEYELLRRKKAERQGNTETAHVVDVFVNPAEVVVTCSFDWERDERRFRYDLDDSRDKLELEALAEAHGFAFEQVSHLEGTEVELTYTGDEWVPSAHAQFAEGQGSAAETFRTESRLLLRELARSPNFLRRLLKKTRSASAENAVLVAIVIKKLLIAGAIVYLLVGGF